MEWKEHSQESEIWTVLAHSVACDLWSWTELQIEIWNDFESVKLEGRGRHVFKPDDDSSKEQNEK